MAKVAGVDGTPKGWVVVTSQASKLAIHEARILSDLFEDTEVYEVVAVDVPIGLLDAYQVGGRTCDIAARRLLGKTRRSSVFPSPVRPVLSAKSYLDACDRSRRSAPEGKKISQQTYATLPKIKEVDELLQVRPALRVIVREIHPEVCFCEMAGKPMAHRKTTTLGREERECVLRQYFLDLNEIERKANAMRLPSNDVLDAAAACWSALRLAELPMAIWV